MRPFWVVKIYNGIMIETNVVQWIKYLRKSKHRAVRGERQVPETQLFGEMKHSTVVCVAIGDGQHCWTPRSQAGCSSLTPSRSAPAHTTASLAPPPGPRREVLRTGLRRPVAAAPPLPGSASFPQSGVQAALPFLSFSGETGTLDLHAASQVFTVRLIINKTR